MKLQSPEFNLTSLLSHITVLLTLICILHLVCHIYQFHGINMGDLPDILELILVITVLRSFFNRHFPRGLPGYTVYLLLHYSVEDEPGRGSYIC